jgi:polysaccharide biosynthesis transport protein
MAFNDDADRMEQDSGAASGSRGFVAVLWQRKALIVLGAVLGLIGGSLVYSQKAPVYSSGVPIMITKRNSMPQPGVDPRTVVYDDYMSTHMQLLRSTLIAEGAVKKRDLATLKTFENGDPVGIIVGGLTVTRDTKDVMGQGTNNILTVSFKGPVAEDCGKILTAVIESYEEFLNKAFRNASADAMKLIKDASHILDADVNTAQAALDKFRFETNAFLRGKDGVSIQMERILTVERERSKLMTLLTVMRKNISYLQTETDKGKGEAEAALEVLTRIKEAQGPIEDKTVETYLLPHVLDLQKELEIYGENHPNVVRVKKRIETVRKHYTESMSARLVKADKRTPLQRLQAEETHTNNLPAVFTGELEILKKEAKDLSKNEIMESALRRNFERVNELYDETMKQLKKFDINEKGGGFVTAVLGQPGVGGKIAPSMFQFTVAGLMLGLLAGIGLAYLADLTDKSFRNPDEVRRRLGLPVLGHVPFLKPDPDVARRVADGEIFVDPLLYTLFKPKSLESEAYRAIRTSVFFNTQGEGHKVLQVTSPNKGDGKSLMVSNLAISMAQSGKKVLIIDADCRRPRQHRVFHLPNTEGLTSVITGKTKLQDAFHTTPVDGLWVMPAGPIPPNPSELLSTPRFKELLATAREEFDYVLVDTAPLLAVTDPCVVAGLVDGLVLIIRLSRHGRPNAERARAIMESLDVNVLGVVVNGVTRQGGAGIYSSEHYDYTDSYEENEAPDEKEEGYYYQDEEETVGAAAKN